MVVIWERGCGLMCVLQPILDILAEMIAVDPSISVSGSSSDAGHGTVE